MNLLSYLVPFVLALGLLILVHELGHYLVARWCGVKVLRFSIGFGKPLLVRRAGADRTEWALAAFPLGGYVKMLDEREAPVAPAELHRAFNRQSVYRRFAIVAAGPLANFLLAIVLYWGLFVAGTEELQPRVALAQPSSIAATAGLRDGACTAASESCTGTPASANICAVADLPMPIEPVRPTMIMPAPPANVAAPSRHRA